MTIKKRSGLMADTLAYGGIGVIVQAVRLVQEVALRRILTPEIIGIIGLADLIQSSVKNLDLGIVTAASRELPLLRGAGRFEQAGVVRATALRSYIAQNAFFAVLVALYAVFAVSDPRIQGALLAASVVLVLTSSCEARQLALETAQKFAGLGRVGLMFAFAYMAGVVLGAKLFGLMGALIGAIAAWAAQDYWLRRCVEAQDIGAEGRWNFETLRELVKFGLPLRFCDYPTAFASLVDAMIVGKVLGLESLAMYSTLRAFCSQALQLPSRFSSVVLMRIYHNDAGQGRIASADLLKKFLTIQYALALPVIIAGCVAGLRLLTTCLLPHYENIVPLARILLLEFYFVPQVSIMRNYWILDKNLGMIAASGGVWIVDRVGFLYWGFHFQGLGLSWAVWACLASAAIYHSYLLITIGRKLWGISGALKLGALAVFSAAYTGFAVRWFDVPTASNWAAALGGVIIQAGLTLGALSPLVVWGAYTLMRLRKARMV